MTSPITALLKEMEPVKIEILTPGMMRMLETQPPLRPQTEECSRLERH